MKFHYGLPIINNLTSEQTKSFFIRSTYYILEYIIPGHEYFFCYNSML
jgi:hypothetical protein